MYKSLEQTYTNFSGFLNTLLFLTNIKVSPSHLSLSFCYIYTSLFKYSYCEGRPPPCPAETAGSAEDPYLYTRPEGESGPIPVYYARRGVWTHPYIPGQRGSLDPSLYTRPEGESGPIPIY